MTVRPATPADLREIVRIHLAAFPGFFLSFLGPRFLRLLYLQMLNQEGGILLVAEADNAVCGFVGGVTQQAGFYRRLVRHNLVSFAWASAGAVLRRPSVMPRLWRSLRRSTEARQSAAEACLMSIGVDPQVSGKGVGRKLADAFCDELRKKGAPSVCLTTDKMNNERVNRFYQGLGFVVAREFTTPEGRQMYEYVKTLGH